MNRFIRTIVLGAGLSLLAACGGGGGGGGNPPVVAAPDAAIDSQNAVEIAGDVVTGVLDSGELGAFGGSGLIGAERRRHAGHVQGLRVRGQKGHRRSDDGAVWSRGVPVRDGRHGVGLWQSAQPGHAEPR